MHAIGRRRLLIVTGVATALLAAACGGGGGGQPPPVQIKPSEDSQVSPAIHGSSVVWEDSRNDETDGTDVVMYDAGTGTETLVAGGRFDQAEPAVSDRYVVWIDRGRLRAMDRSNGSMFWVATGTTQTDPALCGSVVTWTDSRNSTPDVYARDLAGGSEIALASTSAVEAYPACDNRRVVYMEAPSNPGQSSSIRLYNLDTGQRSLVSDTQWNEWRPAISGDRVVWQEWPNQPPPGDPEPVAGIQILGKHLSTGERFSVTTANGHQTAPVISGALVAWEDARSGDTRVWWRDLATTTERNVGASQSGRQQAPALSGRSLAYQADASGAWNIYLVQNLGL
jgi:TolB protein